MQIASVTVRGTHKAQESINPIIDSARRLKADHRSRQAAINQLKRDVPLRR